MYFASDNTAGMAPEILAALGKANTGYALGYGNDEWTRRVEARFAEIFEREVAVFLVPTGTAANALALAHVTPPWGAVLCHAESHVATDECGAPEFFGGGIKLVGLGGEGSKISAATLRAALDGQWGGPHHVSPAALSLSQATECGTIYRVAEIKELADIAHARGVARAHGRRAHRQCARAHERLAGRAHLEGRRRCAVVRRHQGRRDGRRSRDLLRSEARREHAGPAQARRRDSLQSIASSRRRSRRFCRTISGSSSRGMPTRWRTRSRQGLDGSGLQAGVAGRGERSVRAADRSRPTSG